MGNKFWMANYAAELNVQLYREAQRSRISTFDLPIPISVTYKIGNEIKNIQYRYKHEYEIPQIKAIENSIREDTFFETVLAKTRPDWFLEDIALQPCSRKHNLGNVE